MSRVVALMRYPLKSARPELLPDATVHQRGFHGDRLWACLDGTDGTLGSLKHPGRWGGLLDVSATVGDPVDGADPPVTVHVAGGSFAAGSPAGDAALTTLIGRPVRLINVMPEGARLHRLLPEQEGMVPDWMGAAAGEETITKLSSERPGGRFVDFGAVHIVTTGALAALASRAGTAAVPPVRFRPNLVIEAPADPPPGTCLQLGDVLLRVQMPTVRCIVPGLDRDPSTPDRAVLAALARDYRQEIAGRGRGACFGFYAEVLRAGRLHVGQRVVPADHAEVAR